MGEVGIGPAELSACLRVNELKWALYGWVGRYPEVNHLHGTISGLFRPTFPKI